MRKYIYLFATFVLALSCHKETPETSCATHQFAVDAEMAEMEDIATKASGLSVIRLSWTKGDKISVINVTTGKALGGSLSANSAGTTTTFTGTLTGTINAGDKLAFLYPCQNYTAEADFSSATIGYSTQTTTDPSLAMVAHHTVADASNQITNLSVNFEFLMSFIRINLTELPISTPVTSVEISGMNDRLTCSISNDKLTANASSGSGSGNATVSYTASLNTNVRGNKTIFMGILASTTPNRTITVNTSTTSFSAYFSNVTFSAGKSYNTIAAGFVQSMLTFKDASVKAKCLELFDKNADGQISFLEAATVSDLGVSTRSAGENPFPKSILHFAELQFFSSLQSLPSFEGYDMLKTVAIPAQIATLPANTFKNCSALEAVVFTADTPPTLGNDVFAGCDANLLLYVPTAAVSAYKTVLPSMASRIHDIAEVGADFGLDGWSDGGNIHGSAD